MVGTADGLVEEETQARSSGVKRESVKGGGNSKPPALSGRSVLTAATWAEKIINWGTIPLPFFRFTIPTGNHVLFLLLLPFVK